MTTEGFDIWSVSPHSRWYIRTRKLDFGTCAKAMNELRNVQWCRNINIKFQLTRYLAIKSDLEIWLGNLFFFYHQVPHKPGMPTFAFSVQEKKEAGNIDVRKLMDIGIPPGPVYSLLKLGNVVTLPDGRTIDGKDYVGPHKPGRKFSYIADTWDSTKAVPLVHFFFIINLSANAELKTRKFDSEIWFGNLIRKFDSEIWFENYRSRALMSSSTNPHSNGVIKTIISAAKNSF